MARYIVTGAAGFIGANFVRWALESGECKTPIERLVVLDSLTYAGNLANLGFTTERSAGIVHGVVTG